MLVNVLKSTNLDTHKGGWEELSKKGRSGYSSKAWMLWKFILIDYYVSTQNVGYES